MPFVWAKQTKVFQEVVESSDMFYPHGIVLSRKEKLSIVWLAANYDPDKNKKIVSIRDCEAANIVRICQAIRNPVCPFALRLSAQLLLGTVRVYRTKTKLLLDFAQEMVFKLGSLLKEARSFEMLEPTVRMETITMAETTGGTSIIDYSLEPVYYDPQMIMHMNEGDFITINGTPMQSPIKPSKPNVTPIKRTSLIVPNETISMQEDLFSPNKPIVIPGEEDFGAQSFGPAQENFLEDFKEFGEEEVIPSVRRRLHIIDEDDEMGEGRQIVPHPSEVDIAGASMHTVPHQELDNEDLNKSKKRKADGVQANSQVENRNVDQQHNTYQQNDMEINRDEGPLSGIIRNRLTDINRNLEIQQDAILDNNEDNEDMLPSQRLNDVTEILPIVDEEEETHHTTEQPSAFQTDIPDITKAKPARDWEDNFVTPADHIALNPTPSHPKKKRKLNIDREIYIDSTEMRKNIIDQNNYRKRPIIAGTALPSAKELTRMPTTISVAQLLRFPKIKSYWDNNTRVVSQRYSKRDLQMFRVGTTTEEEEEEENEFENAVDETPGVFRNPNETPGNFRVSNDTPASIEVERAAGSVMLPTFEHSAGSSLLVNKTPAEEASVRSSFDMNIGEESLNVRTNASPRMSGVGFLPQDVVVDLADIPELSTEDPLREDQQGQPNLEEQDVAQPVDIEESEEESVDDDGDSYGFQRYIRKSVRSSSKIFHEIFSQHATRREIALALYAGLQLHRSGKIILNQQTMFGDITISRPPSRPAAS